MIYLLRITALGLSFCYTLFASDVFGAETYLFSFVLVTNSLWITRLCREDGDIIIATERSHNKNANYQARHVTIKSAIGFLVISLIGCIFVAIEHITILGMILFCSHLFLTFAIMLIGLFARAKGLTLIASVCDLTGARWALLVAAAFIGWSLPGIKENTNILLYQSAIGLAIFLIYKINIGYYNKKNKILVGPSLLLQLYNLLLPKLFEITSLHEQFIFYKSMEIFLLTAKISNFVQTFTYKVEGYKKDIVFWFTIIGLIISYTLIYMYSNMVEVEFFKYISDLSVLEFLFSMILLLACVSVYLICGPVDYLFYQSKLLILIKSYLVLILFTLAAFAVLFVFEITDWIVYLLLLAPALRRLYVVKS